MDGFPILLFSCYCLSFPNSSFYYKVYILFPIFATAREEEGPADFDECMTMCIAEHDEDDCEKGCGSVFSGDRDDDEEGSGEGPEGCDPDTEYWDDDYEECVDIPDTTADDDNDDMQFRSDNGTAADTCEDLCFADENDCEKGNEACEEDVHAYCAVDCCEHECEDAHDDCDEECENYCADKCAIDDDATTDTDVEGSGEEEFDDDEM